MATDPFGFSTANRVAQEIARVEPEPASTASRAGSRKRKSSAGAATSGPLRSSTSNVPFRSIIGSSDSVTRSACPIGKA